MIAHNETHHLEDEVSLEAPAALESFASKISLWLSTLFVMNPMEFVRNKSYQPPNRLEFTCEVGQSISRLT